jgi:ribosomal protein L22
MAPATESIMSSLSLAHAGVGSAMNDTVRMVGGTLGVALLGSLLSSRYGADMEGAVDRLPEPAAEAAGDEPSDEAEPADEPPAEAETADEGEPEDEDDEEAAAVAAKPKRRRRGRTAADEEEPEPAPSPRRNGRRDVEPAVLVRAQARYVRTSARKARLVCNHIRGKDVPEARAILAFTPRAAAKAWTKLLESAVANAEHNHELVGEELRIHSVHADEGPTLKRYRPRAMGRATRIRKRTSHLTITLTPKES